MQDKQKIFYLSLGLFAVMLLWQFLQPFMDDDYWAAAFDVLVNHNILKTLHDRYYDNNGRMFAEWLKFVFESKSYLWFFYPLVKIVTSIVIVITVNLVYQYLFAKEYRFWRYYITTSGFILFYIASGWFAQDFIWYTVAMQYAWGFCVMLWLGLVFYQDYQQDQSASWSQLVLYVILGFLTGLYHEMYIAFIVNVVATAIIITWLFKLDWQRLLKVQYFCFIIPCLLSGIFLVIAPGNFVRRAGFLAHTTNVIHYGLLMKIAMTYVRFFRYGYHVVAGVLLAFIGIYLYKKRSTLPRSLLIFMTFFLILLNLHILSFFMVAYCVAISGRMNIFIDFILYLLFAKMLYFIIEQKYYMLSNKFKIFWVGVSFLVIIWVSYSYLLLYQFYQERFKLIEIAKSKHIQDLIVPPYCESSFFRWPVHFEDITPDKNLLPNFGIADYFAIRSIAVKANVCASQKRY